MGAQCSVDDVYELEGALENERNETKWSVHPAIKKDDDSKVTVFVCPRDKEKDKLAERERFKYLRVLRHPSILKFYESYETSKEISVITEPVRPLDLLLDNLELLEIIAGLHSIIQALIFLHDKGGLSHNNICMSSVFVSEHTGLWKLGAMENVCKFEDVKTEKLVSNEQIEFGHTHDAYSFGVLFCEIFETRSDLGSSISKLVNKIQDEFLHEDPKVRPKVKTLLQEDFFRNPYLDILQFLQNITIKTDAEKGKFFSSLAYNLYSVPPEIIAKRLAPQLMNRMVLADDSLVKDFLPHLLTPRLGPKLSEFKPGNINPLIPAEQFKENMIPILMKLFAIRTRHVRMMLLQHFHLYVKMFDKAVLQEYILPKILLGLHDTSDRLVSATFQALSSLVTVLGSKIVVGGDRFKYFPERRPKVAGSTNSTPCPSPPRIDKENGIKRKPSSVSEVMPSPPPSNEQSPKSESGLKSDMNKQKRELEKQQRQEEMRKRNEERKKERERKKAEKIAERLAGNKVSNVIEHQDSWSDSWGDESRTIEAEHTLDSGPPVSTTSEHSSEMTEDIAEEVEFETWESFENSHVIDESRNPSSLEYSSPISEENSRKNSNSWDQDFGGVDFGQLPVVNIGPWSESQGSSPRTSHSSDVEVTASHNSPKPTLLSQVISTTSNTQRLTSDLKSSGEQATKVTPPKKGSNALKLGKGAAWKKDRTINEKSENTLIEKSNLSTKESTSPRNSLGLSSHKGKRKETKFGVKKKPNISSGFGEEFEVKSIHIAVTQPDLFADMAPSIDFINSQGIVDTNKVLTTGNRTNNLTSMGMIDDCKEKLPTTLSSKLVMAEAEHEVESGWDDGDWDEFV